MVRGGSAELELLSALRLLWRRRTLVGVGALVALGGGLLVVQGVGPAASARPDATFVASARMLLDTPDSQLVTVSPRSAETLAVRAALFADLLSSEPLREDIARRAGLRAGQLDVFGPSTRVVPTVSTPLVVKAGERSEVTRARHVVRLYADGLSPMISIEASAPEAGRAERLVDAATGALGSQVAPPGTGAAHGFVLEPIASRNPVEIVGGSRRRVLAVAGSAAVFVLWCGAILVAAGLGTRRRGDPAQPV
jgi:hypothetical protein